MRARASAILFFCCAASLQAATDTTRPAQVTAAAASAVDAIDSDIANQPLGSQATIRDFLQQTHSDAGFRDWLNQSQPVGGPRWLDPQTCQVRIEVDGNKIADWLLATARAHPEQSRFNPDHLSSMLGDLRQRRFEATSTSAASDTINNLTPSTAAGSWDKVSPEQRRHALLLARQNACGRVLQLLAPIEAVRGQTVSDLLVSKPELRGRLWEYLETAPITHVDFQQGLNVQVQLHPSRQELAEMIYTTAVGKSSAHLDADDFRHLQSLHDRIAQQMSNVAGSASASMEYNSLVSPSPAAMSPLIPQQPPAWVDDQIDAVGHGFVPGNQLKSSHAAGHDASLKIRTRLAALHLDQTHTVLDAASRDPHVADAINQALEQARPYKSEFNSDGTVTVHEILDLHDFWQALAGAQ